MFCIIDQHSYCNKLWCKNNLLSEFVCFVQTQIFILLFLMNSFELQGYSLFYYIFTNMFFVFWKCSCRYGLMCLGKTENSTVNLHTDYVGACPCSEPTFTHISGLCHMSLKATSIYLQNVSERISRLLSLSCVKINVPALLFMIGNFLHWWNIWF